MPETPESNARRSLAICSLFESELLVRLIMQHWQHPLADHQEFRDQLLETATNVLDAAANDSRCSFISGMPASDMNLISAIWYAEHRAIEDARLNASEELDGRVRWLNTIRRSLPSCFCPQDDLHLP